MYFEERIPWWLRTLVGIGLFFIALLLCNKSGSDTNFLFFFALIVVLNLFFACESNFSFWVSIAAGIGLTIVEWAMDPSTPFENGVVLASSLVVILSLIYMTCSNTLIDGNEKFSVIYDILYVAVIAVAFILAYVRKETISLTYKDFPVTIIFWGIAIARHALLGWLLDRDRSSSSYSGGGYSGGGSGGGSSSKSHPPRDVVEAAAYYAASKTNFVVTGIRGSMSYKISARYTRNGVISFDADKDSFRYYAKAHVEYEGYDPSCLNFDFDYR